MSNEKYMIWYRLNNDKRYYINNYGQHIEITSPISNDSIKWYSEKGAKQVTTMLWKKMAFTEHSICFSEYVSENYILERHTIKGMINLPMNNEQ